MCHKCKVEGELNIDDEVVCELDWERRHWYMRVHTAGHLVHDALMSLVDGLVPIRGDHSDQPYLKYKGVIEDKNIQKKLEDLVNQLIAEDRPVVTEDITLEELKRRAKFIPPNLPKGKPLRVLQIAGFDAMPDGGVQVKKLGEIGKIAITHIRTRKGNTTIKYSVS